MSNPSYHKKVIQDRELHPETQMMSYGYDPSCRRARSSRRCS